MKLFYLVVCQVVSLAILPFNPKLQTCQ